MPASLNDYLDSYKQACTAYAQQNYDVAATLVDEVVQNVPDDPNCHLLRGHIYYVLQQYDVAEQEYQKVLQLSNDPEIIGFANNGLQSINQYQEPLDSQIGTEENHQPEPDHFTDISEDLESNPPELEDLGVFGNLDSNSFELNPLEEIQPFVDLDELPSNNPFEISSDSVSFEQTPDSTAPLSEDPFALSQNQNGKESHANTANEPFELELPVFWQEEMAAKSVNDPEITSDLSSSETDYSEEMSLVYDEDLDDTAFAAANFSTSNSLEHTPEPVIEEPEEEPNMANFALEINSQEDETLPMHQENLQHDSTETNNLSHNYQAHLPDADPSNWLEQIEVEQIEVEEIEVEEIEVEEKLSAPSSSLNGRYSVKDQESSHHAALDINHFDGDDFDDFEVFKSAFGSDEDTNSLLKGENSQSNIEFLDDFDEFDDLGNIPGFDLAEADSSFGDVTMLSGSLDTTGSLESQDAKPHAKTESSPREGRRSRSDRTEKNRDDELFSITGSHNGGKEAVPIFTETDVSKLEPNVSVEQGWLAPLENASLDVKPWFVAGTVGVFSALVVATVSFTATNFSPPEQRESVRNTGWAMSLAAGIAGFGTAAFMGNLTLKQIRRTTKDLQAQFDAVRQGNLNVQATVYSEDELGRLATGFNEMARVIFTTTHEAQRKADEQEEAKENLQRQVIRLLDDVEGAARGDLTVQAEVTADVLGAVADAFNLTIQNLRDIVQQVKVAAKEVTKGSTNSETFARALSSDALRQAEELGVTLNSVQVMTESIQRVAEAAREAEIVAGDASRIALKGGEAVENTVAGILEIRETVAETTRKVKRLAESSQEISKIVALISQIASRTNLLALNASIEAARAGEAGRGFAIVADEVRQLADKSAKSLKEIEQIVMQIQSETGSVMTAMEEGTQQVIKGTKLAEEAKRSLENIIQVANRIDTLVRSITSDTVEQTETSRAVAHVMQSVELTAQETSQEAQRVSGALQLLVGVSGDLISSVERFRVETLDSR
ncbi:methyl-accepting chemotaxis protein [Nodularia spumigena]|uniref:methyl-accepting chemotaxis protein n=1 Tax=Nodularia spumigena TaxID=70799 RepID=UPI00232BECE5|nr:methyl-accepting chemotaxis protein [Nodularia spumigena]MDB9318321.1 methyl-accepting chemotaxis protein [Nodularia spumigena CS-590/01A]MDB9328830.1 methyl-accepting chemotaxis protein [Nodularia spumigena CS-590/02]MDB9334561.1 methyl-accepting chemotaxis protein [Nodularia spumigena CS-590/01]